jgi:hypothetical protein
MLDWKELKILSASGPNALGWPEETAIAYRSFFITFLAALTTWRSN